MERAVVTAADRILVTSPGALQEIGLDDASKGAVIPNGWDKDDFPDTPPAHASNDKPVLGHFGALYGARNAPALWSALGESDWVLKAGGQLSDDVRASMDQCGVELDWQGRPVPCPSHEKPCTHATRWWSSTTTATRPRPPPLERCSSAWPRASHARRRTGGWRPASPVRHVGRDVCAPRRARWAGSESIPGSKPLRCARQIFPCVV